MKLKLSIEESCNIFKKRFEGLGINTYQIFKSLVYFEDAEEDPEPILKVKSSEWEWEKVKDFFIRNIKEFEKNLT